MSDVVERLEELRGAGLYRRMRLVEGPQGPRVTLDGAEVLLLCSNNYLGLADHPRVRQAAADAAERYGAGAGASRLISGNMSPHRRLEERLAAFAGYEAALLFGSGYLANLGAIAALTGRGRAVFSDELNHASIIDGCRISRAERFVYRHADLEHLAWGLRKEARHGGLIVTDAVFSMDGDVAPIADLLDLARRHRCLLMVDEAHATGALGPAGAGAVAEAGLSGEVDLIVGTLGKTLGSYGAYVCGSAQLVDLLINTARPFIFSTALPPPVIGAALAALALLEGQPGLVKQLVRNGAILREALAGHGLEVGPSRTQIVPVVVGEARQATALCERALEGGVFAQAIRPPTVPEGTSRLRLSAMANHRQDELHAAAGVIAHTARDLDIVVGGEARTGPAWRLRRAA
ncbi:MAG TPA: 8-amino-7-oxononanoate synthase [Solirubrobacterales bacterium]|nr:8-amino-7-oxononanoate synthase [Solirubrobacterales bacterium]